MNGETVADRKWTLYWEIPFLFLFGGVAYFGLELWVRGWSHWTMALCGGVCFLLLYRVNERWLDHTVFLRAVIGTLLITGVELVAGCIMNLWLGLGIWDYSAHRFQLWGQISLRTSGVWFLLAYLACPVCRWIRRRVFLAAA